MTHGLYGFDENGEPMWDDCPGCGYAPGRQSDGLCSHCATEADAETGTGEEDMSVPNIAIGSDTWPGLAKLMEECGELVQVCAKIAAFPDTAELHPDGSDLRERIMEEMGDVCAAIDFAINANSLQYSVVQDRAKEKVALFNRWHAEGGSV